MCDEISLQIKIERVLAELDTWFNRSDLVINAGKTGVMSFYNRQTHFPVKPLVTLNKMTTDYTAEMKFLGIQITDTLKWHPHIQLLESKLSKVAFMIKSLKEILSPNLIHNIYFTKFQSLLGFDILFWGRIKYKNTQNTKTSDEINGSSKLKNILQAAV